MSDIRNERRENLRRKRLEAEDAASTGDRRKTALKAITATALAALLAVAAVFVAITSGGSEVEAQKTSSEINRLFRGIPQDGTALGNPKAKVTVIEFGDLQCPACRQFAEEVVPGLVDGPIRDGKVKLEFLSWGALGADSNLAAKASLAASLQGRYWQFIEAYFGEQENARSDLTDDLLRSVAERAGVPDLDRWEVDRNDPRWDLELTNNQTLAMELGIEGPPTIAIKDANGDLTLLDGRSLTEIESAIEKALDTDAST